MTIRFLCPLGHPLAVPDNRAGKKGRCPVCRQRVYVPRPSGGGSLSDDDVADFLADAMVEDDDESADGVESDDDLAAPPADAARKIPKKPSPDPSSVAKGRAPVDSRAIAPGDSALRRPKPKGAPAPEARSHDSARDHHKWLEGMVGQWDYRLKLWPEPGGAPSLSAGFAEGKWIMGQRFVQVRSQGKLLDETFQSLWTLGYDNAKKAYISLYLDDTSTSFSLADGHAASGGQTLKLFGAMHGYATGQHNRAYLYAICLVAPEKWTLGIEDVLSGEKVVEIVYSRKK
jgi:hypothetical protein